jgi:Tfp pilus assembly protein PilX
MRPRELGLLGITISHSVAMRERWSANHTNKDKGTRAGCRADDEEELVQCLLA